MGPEEFFHRSKLINQNDLFEMRVKSLDWMLGCFKNGTIRRRTIMNLIPLSNLYDLLNHMEIRERYEDCIIIKEVIDTIYEQNFNIKSINMSKKRRDEIIGLLTNTIQKENEKVGGGNKEIIVKLSKKLEQIKDYKKSKDSKK